MTATQSLKIFEILGKHFNNAEDARTVVTEIEQIIETKISDKKDILATKEDIAKLKEELKEDIAKLRIEMAENKAEMIKWMFIFWIGQVAATVAIVKLFLH